MHDVVRFGKCLSDPKLLRVINVLRTGELCSCEIEESIGLSSSATRSILKKLQSAGLVLSRKRSRWYAFELDPRYSDLIETLFEAFELDVAFESSMVKDERAVRRLLKLRIEGWCADPQSIKPDKLEHKPSIKASDSDTDRMAALAICLRNILQDDLIVST
jgi:ArsR family transcriptional regulator